MTDRGHGRSGGFTLVELLVVVAIIAILVGILVPAVNLGLNASKKRRAQAECQNIETAVRQFHNDFRYMPWLAEGASMATNRQKAVKWMGADHWTYDSLSHKHDQNTVMEILRGVNQLGKSYLDIPENSLDEEGTFLDPWGNPYVIGMDRDGDGQLEWREETYKGRYKLAVMVYSFGPNGEQDASRKPNGEWTLGDDILSFDPAVGEKEK